MASTSKSPADQDDWESASSGSSQDARESELPKAPTESVCGVCKKPGSEDQRLLKCGRCKSKTYCLKECQKSDWPTHKSNCGPSSANANASSSSAGGPTNKLSPPKGLDQPITKPFTRLHNGTYLHNRPEKDVFRLLIDIYRLMIEDDYKFDGDVDADSIYSGNPRMNGTQGFHRFLKTVERKKRNLLPDWWSDAKRDECIKYGTKPGWSQLNCTIEKTDIIDHYEDDKFAAQLRMFREAVYGRGPGGAKGGQMMRGMMMLEERGMESNMLTFSTPWAFSMGSD